MPSLIDAYLGDVNSLAGSDKFRKLAQEMGKLDVYSAFFSDQPMAFKDFRESLTRKQAAAMRSEVEKGGLLCPHHGIMGGLSVGGGEDV